MNQNFSPITFGKYTLMDRIAIGGMAEVFRAKLTGEKGFEKLIVIKRLLPQIEENEEMKTHFIDEARLAALLQHDNIVHVYDFGHFYNSRFLAMEYLSGKDLAAVLETSKKQNNPLGIGLSLYIAAKICDGLQYAHQLKDLYGQPLNIVHRDINPNNIYITYDGKVKIIDFGIAKTSSQSRRTRTGIIKGKLAYMSPEQANGLYVDHRTDIFALGNLLYEMCTLKQLYEGDTVQVLRKVIHAEYEPIEKVNSHVPKPVTNIIYRALKQAPDDRYQLCGEFLSQIEECLFQLSLRPNAKSLSEFMIELFNMDYEKEKENIIRIMETKNDEISDPSEQHRFKQPAEQETTFMTRDYDMEDDHHSDIKIRNGINLQKKGLSKKYLIPGVCFLFLLTGIFFVLKSDPVKMPANKNRKESSFSSKIQVSKSAPATPSIQPVSNDTVQSSEKNPNVEKIDFLLSRAEKSLEEFRLTTPPENNAFYYYNEIVKLDPSDIKALDGFIRIADRYAYLADKALKKFKYKKAESYIEKGLSVAPRHERLLKLKGEIQKSKPELFLKSLGKNIKGIFD